MIIHSLLQQMANDGFGTVNEDLQMGVLPLDSNSKVRNGIAVTARGGIETYRGRYTQSVDFYVRNTNPIKASQTAQQILEYLKDSYAETCNLPPLQGYTTDSYQNVTITPVSSVEFVGVDENNGHSFVVSGEIRYAKVNEES